MRAGAILAVAMVLAAAGAAAQDNPALAKYEGYWLDPGHALYHNGKLVREFTPEGPERFGDRAAFSPRGRYLAFAVVNSSGGEGLLIYDTTRDRIHRHPGDGTRIANFDWFEYAGDAFVIYSTDFSSDEKPVMWAVDPHTGRAIFRGEGMAYGFLQDRAGGITYYRYASPQEPLRGTLLRFDDMFTGILIDMNWRTEAERKNDYFIIPPEKAEASIAARHEKVLAAITGGDPAAIAAFVHPDSGVLVSLDGRVSGDDRVFRPEDVRSAGVDTTRLRMGTADGTGEPVYGTLADHLRRIGGLDYSNAEAVGYNRVIGRGNTINNVFDRFRDAIVVEYYWDGTEKYAGMDWRSIRLVYTMGSDDWYLAGIVEDGWTI